VNNPTPPNDDWDWPWLYYAGTVLLHVPEERFWRMTPRTLISLLDIYREIQEAKYGGDGKSKAAKPKQGFIDDVLPL
jgi:uncharacterized phage protein (TIGR02216 family)